jgi:hypothetical protein
MLVSAEEADVRRLGQLPPEIWKLAVEVSLRAIWGMVFGDTNVGAVMPEIPASLFQRSRSGSREWAPG